jgi:acyl-CoA thioesterase FadM
LVSLLQESRVALFKDLGFKELDLGDGKTGIIIGDLLINFKAEGFLFDVLSIEDHIDDITDKSLRIFSRVVNTKNNTVLALAETGVVAFDYEERKISTIPKQFLQALERFKR